jgi:hypothetical protein
MYSLDTPPDNIIWAIYFLSVIVSLCIFYLIIKSAVQAGTKKLHDQLFIQNRLLIEQMKREGVEDDRIRELIDREVPA